jgi:hypothetical protein
MEFSTLQPSSIDTSPSPCVESLSLLFTNNELRDATFTQLERFVRVWYAERYTYAPKLSTLKLVLRPDMTPHSISVDGILRFLEFLQTYEVSHSECLNIYLDNFASVNHGYRVSYASGPFVIPTYDRSGAVQRFVKSL